MIIYTDGSFDDVYKIGAFGIFYGINDKRNHGAVLPDSAESSSHAEAFAVLEALKSISNNRLNGRQKKKIIIYTDSLSVVRFINNSVHAVCNLLARDTHLTINAIFEGMLNLPTQYHQILIKCMRMIFSVSTEVYKIKGKDVQSSRLINLKHIKGHSGHRGNEMADKLAYTSMKKARDIYHQANCFIPKDFDLTTLSYQDILNLLKNGLFSSTRSLHRLNSSETNHNGIILEDDGDISTEDSMLQKTLKNSVDFEGLLKKSKEIYIDLTQKETSVEFELIVISDDEADIELIDSKDFQNCINKDNSDVICLGNNARKFVPITDGFEIFD